jgi:hypothetical protein
MSACRRAEGEIVREGRRVLRKLMAREAVLALLPGGESYALMPGGRNGMKPALCVSAEIVEVFRRRDWVAPSAGEGETLAITDAGLGWVKRAFAGEDAFAAQHRMDSLRAVSTPDGSAQTLTVNDGESPIGWLFHRKGLDGRTLITEWQFRAGERLRADFTLAQLAPRLGVDFSAPVVSGRRGAKSGNLPETVLAAKQRFSRALGAVGPGLSDLLFDVCCHLKGLEAAEKGKGWPRRSARIVLRIALDRLAAHYGMGPVVGTGTRLRAWAADETEEIAGRET